MLYAQQKCNDNSCEWKKKKKEMNNTVLTLVYWNFFFVSSVKKLLLKKSEYSILRDRNGMKIINDKV